MENDNDKATQSTDQQPAGITNEELLKQFTEFKQSTALSLEAKDTSIAKLEANNKLLLDEKRQAEQAKEDATKVADKEKSDKLESEGGFKELLDLERKKNQSTQSEMDQMRKDIKESQEKFYSIKRDNIISAGLDAVGVTLGRDMIEPHMRTLVQYNELGEPMVGDKTLHEYIKEWSTTSIAKDFIKNTNTGGGSSPSSSSGTNKPLQEMSFEERNTFFENGGKQPDVFGAFNKQKK